MGLHSQKCLVEVHKDKDVENTIVIQIKVLDV
jgi:hypothetical protein